MAYITANRTDTRPSFLNRVGDFFATLQAGYAAARDFQHLEHMSDDALARKGLTRPDAMRRVMERNFG